MDLEDEYQNSEERQLVERILLGENLAWKQFLLRYKKLMRSAIRSHLNKFRCTYDEFKEEDVYQDVLLKLHRKSLARFSENSDSQSKLKSFLYVVALNHTKDFVKSKLGQASLKEVGVSSDEEDDTIGEEVFVEPSRTEEMYSKEEMRNFVEEQIQSFDTHVQEIVRLYILGEKNIEIARQLNLPNNQVNKAIFRFKKHLKNAFEKEVA